MKTFIKYAFIFFYLILSNINIKSMEAINLDNINKNYHINSYFEYLLDKENKLKIENFILKNANIKFTNDKKKIYKFGLTDSWYWIRFKIKNNSSYSWVLEIEEPLLNIIELYEIRKNNQTSIKKSGISVEIKKKDYRSLNPAFDIKPEKQEETVYYLHYKTSFFTKPFPVSIKTDKFFFEKEKEQNLLFGIIYGIILAIGIYNLILFFSIKDKVYLFYVFFAFFFAAFQMLRNGMLYMYFSFSNVRLLSSIYFISLYILIIIVLHFTRITLYLKKVFPKIDYFFKLSIIFYTLNIFVVPIFYNKHHIIRAC